MTPGLGSASGVGLSSFGILLTGRLELRNDLLSAISLGKDGVWDERYFVLTRKGLHYYVRQRTAEDLQGRDLFGQHEGSVAIRAMRKVVVSGDDDHRPLVFTIQTKGLGRDYTLRARSPELFQRWSSILTSAIDEVQNPPLLGSQDGRSQQGLVFASRSSSFPRVPSLFDFRAPPQKTDNMSHLVLKSSSLRLDVLLETGLPWGVPTTISAERHRVSSRDSLSLRLEGGGTASIPLATSLLSKPAGSLTVRLDAPSIHRTVKMTWRPADSAPWLAPRATPPRRRGGALPSARSALLALALSWAFSRSFPSLCQLPPPLPPSLPLLPPSLLPLLLLALVTAAVRAARAALAWHAARRQTWQLFLAPVPEADSSPREGMRGGVGPGGLSVERLPQGGLDTLPGSGSGSGSHDFSDGEGEGEGGEGELQMDALFAMAASSEHSILAPIAEVCVRAAPRQPTADGLRLDTLFDVFAGVVKIYECAGPTMMLVVKNDRNNLAKAQDALATSGFEREDVTLGELLRHEIAQGLHACGSGDAVALADPSAAIALLWLRRSLAFSLAFFRQLHAGMARLLRGEQQDVDTVEAFKSAYGDELQPYHKWLLRQTFHLTISQAPSYTELAYAAGPGLGDAERDQVLHEEIEALLRAGEPLVKALADAFEELELEDMRRA